MLFLFIVLLILICIIILNQGILVLNFKVLNLNFFGDLEILIRAWGFLFLFIVVIISRTVIIFSFSYIRGLAVRNFVFLYLSFIISMLWLIVNNNFYWMIFGWDGLGVVSFLLIVFYINHESINNGLFTLFQNRVGDLFFVLFILGSFSLVIWSNLILKLGFLFLIVGACVKRAQFPFNSWLLSAIRAPTPISSLVHSSTLVVAGVYILLQFRYCLRDILYVLKYISILSLILRSLGLLIERDMKKLIAYSTISHVSLIMYLIRFSLFKVVYFHLNIHAIFKSLIFMCFGFVMLSSFHSQDKRLVSLLRLNPLIKIIYYFSCLCLAGLPFLRAFFSKDFIIEKFIERRLELSFIVLLLMFLRISIYYRIKLLSLIRVLFSFQLIEKSYVGLFRVLLIRAFIVRVINVFITLVFRLRLEIFSFKFSIYLLMVVFFLLRVLYNIRFKFSVYDKIKNFMEIWILNFNSIEKYIYWNIFLLLEYLRMLRIVKLIVLVNWWVVIIVVVLF